jgi:hypothetical protein
MIGGPLRFAPGRLGARIVRAPACRVIGSWVVSWLPCRASQTSWTPRPAQIGGSLAVEAGMATGGAQRRDASAVAG